MFEVGIITKPQGLRGELRVMPVTDDPSRFKQLVGKQVTLRMAGKETIFTISNARLHKNFVLVMFEGVDNRNIAETLMRASIYIQDDLALPLEEGEYFVRDLVGLNIVTREGEALGKLSRVLNTPANDVYVVETPEGDAFMIPATKNVILEVNVPDGKMVINLLDGLRELKI